MHHVRQILGLEIPLQSLARTNEATRVENGTEKRIPRVRSRSNPGGSAGLHLVLHIAAHLEVVMPMKLRPTKCCSLRGPGVNAPAVDVSLHLPVGLWPGWRGVPESFLDVVVQVHSNRSRRQGTRIFQPVTICTAHTVEVQVSVTAKLHVRSPRRCQ